MKAFIIFLSLVFVGCVTANTNSRDVSGVNPSPEKAIVSANDQFEGCLSDCQKDGGILLFCSVSCLKLSKIESLIKVAHDGGVDEYGCHGDYKGRVHCH